MLVGDLRRGSARISAQGGPPVTQQCLVVDGHSSIVRRCLWRISLSERRAQEDRWHSDEGIWSGLRRDPSLSLENARRFVGPARRQSPPSVTPLLGATVTQELIKFGKRCHTFVMGETCANKDEQLFSRKTPWKALKGPKQKRHSGNVSSHAKEWNEGGPP